MAATEKTYPMIGRHSVILLLVVTAGFAQPSLAGTKGKANSPATLALEVVEDIVPKADLEFPFLKIQHSDCHGVVGKIFGTDQVAALIAVEPAGNSQTKRPQQ